MTDPTVDQIAQATGAPVGNVAKVWPLILAALAEQGISTPATQVGAAATVAVEAGAFLPVAERRANAQKQPALWALQSRYWTSGYYGRGFISITWKSNYDRMGKALGIDLTSSPELALVPKVAARILALYFKEERVNTFADAGNWQHVRKAVNGGLVGWDKFIDVVHKLTD